jgi:hypothetical protein
MFNKEILKQNLVNFALALFASFVFAAACYDILLFFGILPFARLYKVYSYHWEHPYQFMFIPCFIFSILGTVFAGKFKKVPYGKQIGLTLLIVFLTILISSPLGGMLWHLHDMLAGFFPENWLWKLIRYGFREGIQMGWLIIALSVPYNIIGITAGFFILRTMSEFPVSKDDCGNGEKSQKYLSEN